MKLIIVDIQPEYESNTTFDIGDMLRKAAEDYSQVLVLFNGEDTLGMISEGELKNFYLEKLDYDEEVFDELLSKSTFFDKGYGFFRDVMDSSVCFDRSSIVKIVKYMINKDVRDIRELEEEDINAIGVDELLFDDLEDYGFWVPDLADELPRWSGSDLAGGARNECMAEVEILGAAQGLSFNHVDDFIYEGENRYNGGIMGESTLLREYIRELLSEDAKSILDLPDDLFVMVKSSPRGGVRFIYVVEVEDTQGVTSYRASNTVKTDHGIEGFVDIKPRSPHRRRTPCDNAWQVVGSGATSGWGPLLYDLAMEYATENGGGLMSDRDSVSPSAEEVWNYYYHGRRDVTSIQMDDEINSLTPGKQDNCDQEIAGWEDYGLDMGGPGDEWKESALSKRYTKSPVTMRKLKSKNKLVYT